MANDEEKGFLVNEKGMEVLVAKFIPTSQYFELSFAVLRTQIVDLRDGQKDIKYEIDRRFEQMDKRFEQVDQGQKLLRADMNKRFEQVEQGQKLLRADMDKRFEQVDKRFEQMVSSIDKLTDKLDNRDNEHRSFTLRMFSISIMISFLGVLGVFLKMFKVV